MEYRQLGRSGLKVPALSLGTATFGGKGKIFEQFGKTGIEEARRLVDLCLDHGIVLFDTADIYSEGISEKILGEALKGNRNRAMLATKGTFPTGAGPNEMGSSRHHIMRACEASLKRLQTDHIDIYFMHGFDALTPVDETLRALDDLVTSGKIGYIGASNFSGWHLMKALATSEKYGLARYVVYQGCYSLVSRHYEWELMPLALDQGVATMVWSPLGWGRLTGKIRRGKPIGDGRIATGGGEAGPPVDNERLYSVVEALDEIALARGKSIPQVALNWVLSRPSVANVVIGARDEAQLLDNLGALDWSLSPEESARLDAVSRETPIYPYWHQMGFDERNPKATSW